MGPILAVVAAGGWALAFVLALLVRMEVRLCNALHTELETRTRGWAAAEKRCDALAAENRALTEELSRAGHNHRAADGLPHGRVPPDDPPEAPAPESAELAAVFYAPEPMTRRPHGGPERVLCVACSSKASDGGGHWSAWRSTMATCEGCGDSTTWRLQRLQVQP